MEREAVRSGEDTIGRKRDKERVTQRGQKAEIWRNGEAVMRRSNRETNGDTQVEIDCDIIYLESCKL